MSADSPESAEDRFQRWKDVDPFPSIGVGLLNSAQVADYVKATGMLDPFDSSEAKLKPASYEVNLLGEYQYWDADGKCKTGTIRRGEKFQLFSNSIAFVQVEPFFRLPSYIAVRFNLKIRHVYRGILLGTGPLVDPGFEGHIFIPLHNLTDCDYIFEGGEGLIWMEFTKLTPRKAVKSDVFVPSDVVFSFRDDKKRKSLSNYLSKANPHRKIASSLPKLTQETDKANAKLEKLTRISGWALLIAAIPILALVIQLFQFVREVREDVRTTAAFSAKVESQIKGQAVNLGSLEASLDDRLTDFERELEELRNQTQEGPQKAKKDTSKK